MTKTVQQIVDEYKNRNAKIRLEEMILKVGDYTLTYKNVANLKLLGDGKISFDYNDQDSVFNKEDCSFSYTDKWKHVVCVADILLMQEAIGEGF